MPIDKALFEAAATFLSRRFPADEPWIGVAAARTQSNRVLVSTSIDNTNPAATLCFETGVFCYALKFDDPIASLLCVSRNDHGKLDVIAPCGLCQERLRLWGPDLEIAVPSDKDTTVWETRSLRDLQPYYWYGPYEDAT